MFLAKLRIYNEHGLLNEILDRNKDILKVTIQELDEFIEYEIKKNQKRILKNKKLEETKQNKTNLKEQSNASLM